MPEVLDREAVKNDMLSSLEESAEWASIRGVQPVVGGSYGKFKHTPSYLSFSHDER